MTTGEILIPWTARLFVACYVARLNLDIRNIGETVSSDRERRIRLARFVWTLGFVLLCLHLIATFHFLFEWRIEKAHEHILKRTIETTGIATGIGLWVNLAFSVVWLVDVIAWGRNLNWCEKTIPYRTVQVFVAFMMIQSTVVFGPRFWIPISTLTGIWCLWLFNGVRRKRAGTDFYSSRGRN